VQGRLVRAALDQRDGGQERPRQRELLSEGWEGERDEPGDAEWAGVSFWRLFAWVMIDDWDGGAGYEYNVMVTSFEDECSGIGHFFEWS